MNLIAIRKLLGCAPNIEIIACSLIKKNCIYKKKNKLSCELNDLRFEFVPSQSKIKTRRILCENELL